MRSPVSMIITLFALLAPPLAAQRRVPRDLSGARGFDYMAASASNHTEHFIHYDPQETKRDLDYAARLHLNQVRVFMPMAAWQNDKEAFRKNIRDFMDAAQAHGMGVMPTMQYGRGMAMNRDAWPQAKEFVADLIATIGKHPALVIWDVENEPDCCALPPTEANRTRMAHAVYMAGLFHQLDPVTPVTIGVAFSDNMIALGDAVDVLSFHNYLSTRAAIRADIQKAKAYAARVGKPLLNTEIGAPGRANPYDIAIEEHMKAGVGWYIWELMVAPNWGKVQGVFYPDGTVRDPAVAAALLGVFRNRDPHALLIVPDNEGWVTKAVEGSRAWLKRPDATWEEGLDLAELSANLLESNQLVALIKPPTMRVEVLRSGKPDMPALRAILEEFTSALEPWRLPPRSRP
jgi:hypothetical protein